MNLKPLCICAFSLTLVTQPASADENGDGKVDVTDAIMALQVAAGDTSVELTTPSANSLSASDGDPADAIYVDEEGNVGIGTTTPTVKLAVDGTINANRLNTTTVSMGGNLLLSQGTSKVFFGSNASHTLFSTDHSSGMQYHHSTGHRFFSSGVETVTISSSGAISVRGQQVIDASGNWVGNMPENWSVCIHEGVQYSTGAVCRNGVGSCNYSTSSNSPTLIQTCQADGTWLAENIVYRSGSGSCAIPSPCGN